MPFMNIAHRGFSSQYPENTLLAFQKALELGMKWMEFDLQITIDGHLVVMHDRTVDRTTKGSGNISDLTLSQIRALDAGSHLSPKFAGEPVPTFTEVLDLLTGKAKMAVELKFISNDPIDQVLQILRERDLIDQVSISSFDLPKLPEVKRLCPECSTTALVKPEIDPNRDWVAEVLSYGVDIFGPHHAQTTPEMVAQAHAQDLLVRCWGLGRPDQVAMNRLIDLGADGTTTDYPDVLLDILRSRNLA